MGKICIFLAEGFEEIEMLAVVDLVRRAGMEISMVSITGEKRVVSSHKVAIEADILFEAVDFAQVEMLVLPGGMPGTKNLEAFAPLMAQLDEFYKNKKPIAAICAAPSILGHRGMLNGRVACSFPEFESHLEGAEVSKNPVEVSEYIITSRGMGTAIPFGLAIVTYFQGEVIADSLAEKIIFDK